MSNVSSDSSSSSVRRPAFGSTWFSDIIESPCFVDKSLLIKAVVEDPSQNILITAPRRFGKTVNLDMLRRFFDIKEENSRSTFEKLKIKDHPKIIEKHCGKYAVLWVDLSRFTTSIDSYKSAIVAIREITHRAYKQYQEILLTSNELYDDDRELCRLWCDKLQYENLSENQVGSGIANLASCLHEHFKTSVLLLVDEFDAICRHAMCKVNQKELDHIIFFYFQLFSLVIKTDKSTRMPYLYRAIFTGITSVTCTDPSGLNNLTIRKFLERSRYVDYYGILLDEFDSLLDKPAYSELTCQCCKSLNLATLRTLILVIFVLVLEQFCFLSTKCALDFEFFERIMFSN